MEDYDFVPKPVPVVALENIKETVQDLANGYLAVLPGKVFSVDDIQVYFGYFMFDAFNR